MFSSLTSLLLSMHIRETESGLIYTRFLRDRDDNTAEEATSSKNVLWIDVKRLPHRRIDL